MGVIMVSDKAPQEVVPITFDFSRVVSSIDSVSTVTINVISGVDGGTGTMLFGASVISGTVVSQLIRNGLDGVFYRVQADILKGSEKYSLACDLPVVDIG